MYVDVLKVINNEEIKSCLQVLVGPDPQLVSQYCFLWWSQMHYCPYLLFGLVLCWAVTANAEWETERADNASAYELQCF